MTLVIVCHIFLLAYAAEREKEREGTERTERTEREREDTHAHTHIVAINGFIVASIALSDVGYYATTTAELRP